MLKKKSTKFLVSCAIMTLGNATGAFADCAPKCEQKPVCAPKPACPPKPCCEPVVCPPMIDDCCKRNVCTPTGMITPRVDLIKGDSMDWFITGDFTYWTAREDNLEYAFTTIEQATGATRGAGQGEVFRPGNKWKPGFKVGLGTDFCHDGWDVYAEYTWFKSNVNSSTGSFTTNPTLNDGYWFVDDATNPGTNTYASASAKWHLKMNIADLELGRNFYVSPRLMLRPFYGLKGAWLKQNFDVAFTNTAGTLVDSMDNNMKTWGVGIRTGMDTSWHFSRSFSIIGNLALTGLWEHFKVQRFDTEETVSTGALESAVDFEEKQYQVKPVIEWMLGLKWETGISCNEYHFSLAAAWEEQVWFGQNKFLRVPGTAMGTGGDLSLQGLTIDARFDF